MEMDSNTVNNRKNKDKRAAVIAAAAVLSSLLIINNLESSPKDTSTSSQNSSSSISTVEKDRKTPPGIENNGDYSTATTTGTDWSKIIGKFSPSVVSLKVNSDAGVGVGSGIIVHEDGTIITNNHVVGGKTGVMIQVIMSDSSIYQAHVVKTDEFNDLAVIKLNDVPEGLKPISFADSSKVKVGDPVLAFGSPLGLSGTVTNGIISAVNRPVHNIDEAKSQEDLQKSMNNVISALQTNAAINPGNSGGALVNSNGELIGVNSSIATDGSSKGNIGIGFAIPSNTVKKITSYLEKGESFPYGKLGVTVSSGVGIEGKHGVLGAEVQNLSSGGGADKAGLKKGDVILALNGEQISSSQALVALTHTYAVGDSIEITFTRRGEEKTVKLTLTE